MSWRLTVALAAALAGPLVVIGALEHAGGSERPRPHHGLLEPGAACLTEVPERASVTVVPAIACPDIFPPELSGDYRAGWIGVGIGLVGAALLLVVVGRRSVSRLAAYGSLAGDAAVCVFAAFMIAASSLESCLLFGCGLPPPWDPFQRAALVLVVQGIAVVPLAAILRRLRD
jgi:hypothetical protein